VAKETMHLRNAGITINSPGRNQYLQQTRAQYSCAVFFGEELAALSGAVSKFSSACLVTVFVAESRNVLV